jgi:predicted transcriptional regulator
MGKIKQRIAAIATERHRIRRELAKSGSQLSAGAEALQLAIGLLRDLPTLYSKYGPEVRQAINDALFTRLYIDQDVTRVDWNDQAAEIYTASQQAGDGIGEIATGTKAKRDTEASRLPTLTDVLLASGEATSRGSWNTTVMAEVLARYSNAEPILARLNLRLARALERDTGLPKVRQWEPHRISSRIGPATIERLVHGYSAGRSTAELAGELGIGETTAREHLHAAGVALRGPRRLSREEVQRIHELHAAGASNSNIASEVGVTKEAVRKRLVASNRGSTCASKES